MREHYAEIRDLGADVVAIGTGDARYAEAFVKEERIPYPVLVDDGRPVMEATIIVEHLDLMHPGPVRMIPSDPRAALQVRFLDRFFDNYVMTPMQRIVFDTIRAPDQRDPAGVADARKLLDSAYRWLDGTLCGRTWAAGDAFSLADCAAAPSLFFADWVQPIDASLASGSSADT